MTNEMETRSFEVRAVKEEARTIEGRAVPYGETIDLGGFKERFEAGAFGDIADVKLFYGHDTPIGKVIDGRDEEDGYYVRAVISDTPKGNEVYTLLKDGVLNRFSVGFVPVENRNDEDVIVRTKASLKEVSVVPFPAYDNAHITSVRSSDSETAQKANSNNTKEDIIMSNEMNAPEVAELREAVSTLERKVEVLGFDKTPAKSEVVYRSGGDFLKALARGEEAAQNEIRAYTGATTADAPARDGWVDRTLRIVEQNRNVVNLFSRAGLPASGNSIEYPQVKTTVGDVAQQVAEGDDLTYLEVQTETLTAPIKVYGGYSELSRQSIERSDVAYLDAVLRFQAQSYAKVTNAAARAALVGGTGYNAPTGLTLATAKGKDWVKVVVDSIAAIEDNGMGAQADFILVSRDVYSGLVTLAGTDERPVFNLNGDSVNSFGGANIRGLSGSLVGLPVVVDAGLGAKSFYVASSEAMTTYENAGAPVRLDDENIINLSKQFSLYGYMAVAIHNPKGIAKPAIA